MEERIIDDEYGRGIRLKKTKEGYVDATDELSEKQEGEEAPAEEGLEEVSFEFPELEEDDEDLVNLTPEEAFELRKKKEEELAARKAEYDRLCDEGESLLSESSFRAAELKFERALSLEEDAARAAAGYWRAKTDGFSRPEVLLDEYAESGFLSMENDLGDGAIELLKKEYKETFEGKIAELKAEEAPLKELVEEKQAKRRAILKTRLSSAWRNFFISLLPALVFLVAGIVFATKITSRIDNFYLYFAIGSGALFLIFFFVFVLFANKLLNTLRLNRSNENFASTEDGERLLKIRSYLDIYEHLV